MNTKPVMEVLPPRFTSFAQVESWADDVFRYLVSMDAWAGAVQKEMRGKVAKSVFRGFTVTNVTTDRILDADSTTPEENADILGTLISDAGEA